MTVKIGDKIRIVDARPAYTADYKVGDIFYVSNVWDNGGGVDIGSGEDDSLIEIYNGEFEVVSDAHVASEIPRFNIADLNGKLLRIYTGTDVEGDLKTEVTVGIDEATGVMYVLGMKTEAVE